MNREPVVLRGDRCWDEPSPALLGYHKPFESMS